MGCRGLQIVLMQVARGETVAFEARKRALTHSYVCEACSSVLARSQLLTEALMTLSAANRSLETPAAVEENLLRAFRRTSQQGSRLENRSRKAFWKVELAAAAAVVLAVSLAGLHMVRRRSGASPAQPASAAAPLAKEGPAPVSPAAQPVAHLNQHSVRATSRNREVVMNRKDALQGFLPLPNADDSDGGMLAMVRIEFQAGALEALGMTAPEGNNSRPVVADVLIGNDGMARAIRFDQ